MKNQYITRNSHANALDSKDSRHPGVNQGSHRKIHKSAHPMNGNHTQVTESHFREDSLKRPLKKMPSKTSGDKSAKASARVATRGRATLLHLHTPRRRKPRNKRPHATKHLTALDILHKHGIITTEMWHAALRYGELCHARPAGGPHISRSVTTMKVRVTNPMHYYLPAHLEALWRHLHYTLRRSPAHRLCHALICEDSLSALSTLSQDLKARERVQSTLKLLADALTEFEREKFERVAEKKRAPGKPPTPKQALKSAPELEQPQCHSRTRTPHRV